MDLSEIMDISVAQARRLLIAASQCIAPAYMTAAQMLVVRPGEEGETECASRAGMCLVGRCPGLQPLAGFSSLCCQSRPEGDRTAGISLVRRCTESQLLAGCSGAARWWGCLMEKMG